ncbi:MAG: hypothetical protein QF567_03020, partial [Candidatus Pacearchaeota archaeon]|nr:hypothetical protein [Candidatus Pacearchaeota archaeon]
SILVVLMLISFNLSNIVEEGISEQNINAKNKLTGLAIDDEEQEEEEEEEEQEELYTEKSYLIYYILLGFLGFCIFILSSIFFLPRLKEFT